MGSSRSDGSGKERLKWNQELHDLFERAVNQLGGPDSKFKIINYGTILCAIFWFTWLVRDSSQLCC